MTRNRRDRISKARPCPILCASGAGPAFTRAIFRDIRHRTAVFECRSLWPKTFSNRFPSALRLRSRLRPDPDRDLLKSRNFRRTFAVDKSGNLLELVAQSAPIAEKLRQIDERAWPIAFSHVIDA